MIMIINFVSHSWLSKCGSGGMPTQLIAAIVRCTKCHDLSNEAAFVKILGTNINLIIYAIIKASNIWCHVRNITINGEHTVPRWLFDLVKRVINAAMYQTTAESSRTVYQISGRLTTTATGGALWKVDTGQSCDRRRASNQTC